MPLAILSTLVIAMAQSPAVPAGSAGVDPATLGPAIGQQLPSFEAPGQEGQRRDFASLRGPRGLVLVFFRSADW